MKIKGSSAKLQRSCWVCQLDAWTGLWKKQATLVKLWFYSTPQPSFTHTLAFDVHWNQNIGIQCVRAGIQTQCVFAIYWLAIAVGQTLEQSHAATMAHATIYHNAGRRAKTAQTGTGCKQYRQTDTHATHAEGPIEVNAQQTRHANAAREAGRQTANPINSRRCRNKQKIKLRQVWRALPNQNKNQT